MASACLFAGVCYCSATLAQVEPAADRGPLPEASARATVDPTLMILRRVSQREPEPWSVFAPNAHFTRDGAAVSLRFDAPLDAQTRRMLSSWGVQIDGEVFSERGLYRAWMPWSALESLRRLGPLRHVEALWQARLQTPLTYTSREVGAEQARRRVFDGLAGSGARLGLIDTGIDVLHPAFFRPNGGYYSWIDRDGDGVFTAEADAVDLDADAVADANETLRVLDATVIADFEDGDVRNENGTLDVRQDWVFADMNRDGERNAGAEAGFNEATPAYGEPLFVVDDANANGALDVEEKLVRLGSSKIASYRTQSAVYLRGENLIAAAAESADAYHGTGVASVLVGGQDGFHDRVGLAPGADLYVYGLSATLQRANALPLSFLEAAVEAPVDVVLHEWTNPYSQPLDGSTNFEEAMRAAAGSGLVHVNPVGNLNTARKHRIAAATPAAPVRMDFEVGEGFEGQTSTLEYRSAFGSLQWASGHPDLVLELVSPSGERVSWPVGGAATLALDGAVLDVAAAVTPAGFTYTELYLEAASGRDRLEVGTWQIELEGFRDVDEVWGRITDVYSNWRPGIQWAEPTVDRGTVAFPSTAEVAVGVGAAAGRDLDGESASRELRDFSGRGPSLDGRRVVDITGPDNPFVALGATPDVLAAGWGRSWYASFGGTSGAAPHVAGTLALMRVLWAEASPEELAQQLFEAADARDLDPTPDSLPDTGWGHGRLDVYRALLGEPRPEPLPRPDARLAVEFTPTGVRFDAKASTGATPLMYRFDAEYDGAWETAWQSSPVLDLPSGALPKEGVAKLLVRDEEGNEHGATTPFRAEDYEDAAIDADASPADAAAAGRPPRGCSIGEGTGWPSPWHGLFALVIVTRARGRRRGELVEP